jgi:hypothetical protein
LKRPTKRELELHGTNATGTFLDTYVYHRTEERIWKKTVYNPDGSSKENTTYITQTFVRVTNTSGSFDYTYVYHNGQLIAQSVNGTRLFMANDHKGNIVALMNASGAVIENTSYSPYARSLAIAYNVLFPLFRS